MSRNKVRKPDFHAFCQALDMPSSHAENRDKDGIRITISPFSETKSIEESFVLAVAEPQVTFENPPAYARKNVSESGLAQLRSGLINQYATLQQGGWYSHLEHFDPEAAVKKLEQGTLALAQHPPVAHKER